GPGLFELSVDPGQTLTDAFLLLTDSDGDLLELVVNSVTPGALGGVASPPSPTLGFSPLRIDWTGTANSDMPPGIYAYSMELRDGVNLPVAFTVTIELNNLPPAASAGADLLPSNPGTGIAGDPFRAEITAGTSSDLEMALIEDANTGQVI